MQLTYINASPRGKSSNTEQHVHHFVKAYEENEGCTCDQYYLNHYRKKLDELSEIFWNSENVLIGFPLYVDCVPGSLKGFMEELVKYKKDRKTRVAFFSQCGFPEAAHLRFMERYLEKYTKRIGCHYLGSIMKGGGEGLHIQPPVFWEKSTSRLESLGKVFGKRGILDETLLTKLSNPEHLTMDQINGLVPYINENLWDAWMKDNDALEKSFDQPYKTVES